MAFCLIDKKVSFLGTMRILIEASSYVHIVNMREARCAGAVKVMSSRIEKSCMEE